MMDALGSLARRIAAAPISWGVCEVPGWGEMMPSDRVLPEMRSLGLTATELGAPGFLPDDAGKLAEVLAGEGMTLVGGFVPLVLHDRQRWTEAFASARAVASRFRDLGATRFVTAVVQDYDWPEPESPTVETMKVIADGLAKVDEICAEHGLVQTLHPHVGTLVESRRDVELALELSDVRWCLDTGHLQIGGVDPVAFAREHGSRVGHVHLKDMDTAIATQVMNRELSLLAGVQRGLFRELGDGDVAVDDVILALEGHGYSGWYVLEQDTALTQGLPAPGSGPVEAVRRSLDYLRTTVVPRIPAASSH